MAVRQDHILAFNRGVLSPFSRYRADVKRVGMSAEEQMNWIPRTMGPMSLRPGLRYIGPTHTANGVVKHLPFIFANDDTALIEVTDETIRVRVDEALVTRPSVATVTTNGNFDTDVANWTDADQAGAASIWETGGYMSLTGTGTNGAIRYQQLTVAGGDQNVQHALRIVVTQGKVGLRVGTTVDDDDYITETYLEVGEHSLAFTPTGANVYVLFFNRSLETALVASCNIESAGTMTLATGLLSDETLDEVRYAQSGDIIFIARGVSRVPVKIERRGTNSWSVVTYTSNNGPFLADNVSPVTLTPSALTGYITLQASQNIFKSTNVGSLYTLNHTGQTVTATLGALNDSTDAIRVTGIGNNRIFSIDITGTWTATIDLEQSLVEEGNWVTVATYNANQTITYDDGLDNQIAYYRLTVSAYTSGSADGTLSIPTGTSTGIVRVTAYTDPNTVTAIVLDPLGAVTATDNWSEGAWSDRRGYPSAVAFFQGRLYWAGKDKIWASVVDDFYNFNRDYVGDAAPLNRSIGTGPVDYINWLMPLRVLMLGAQAAEYSCRSNGFEEPITPTNFNLREESTIGSDAIECVKIDNSVIYMDRTGSHVMQTDSNQDGLTTNELSILTPEICLPNIKRIAVQRRPDTRVHLLRCDGTVVIMVYDKAEQVNAFVTFETEGLVEDIVVLPGAPEDAVYYTVARVVDGVVVRYLERWALMTEAEGGVENKIADSYLIYDGASTSTVTGLDYLEGKSVVAWGNSKDLGTYTVTSGSITLSEAVTYAVIGLSYYANFVSGKLEFLTGGPSSLGSEKRIVSAYIPLRNTHKQGLEYGTDADYLDNLPLVEDEATVAADYLWETYDKDELILNGSYDSDTRLILKATAPRPCTVMAAVVTVEGD